MNRRSDPRGSRKRKGTAIRRSFLFYKKFLRRAALRRECALRAHFMGRAAFDQLGIFTKPPVPGDGRGKRDPEFFGDVLADKIGIVTDIGNIRLKTREPELACDDRV